MTLKCCSSSLLIPCRTNQRAVSSSVGIVVPPTRYILLCKERATRMWTVSVCLPIESNRRRKNGSIASEWNKLFARLWGRLAFKLAFSPLLQREMQNQCILASIFIVGVPHLPGRIVMPHKIATDFVEQVGGKTVLNSLGFIPMDKQIIFYGFAKFTSRTTRIRWAWLPLGCFVDDWRFNSQQFQLYTCNELVGGRSSEAEKLKDSTWGQ